MRRSFLGILVFVALPMFAASAEQAPIVRHSEETDKAICLDQDRAAEDIKSACVSALASGFHTDQTKARLHNNLGSALVELKQYDAGQAEFRTALEIKPEFARAITNSGWAYWHASKYEQAEKAF